MRIDGVEFESLVGLHVLDGRGEYVSCDSGGPLALMDARAVVLRIDGKLYRFAESPNDGYRSSLGTIDVIDPADVPPGSFVPFQAMAITIRRFHGKRPGSEYYLDDVIVAVSEAHGMAVFVVGTENTDDYYPSFCSRWTPDGDPSCVYLRTSEDPS